MTSLSRYSQSSCLAKVIAAVPNNLKPALGIDFGSPSVDDGVSNFLELSGPGPHGDE
jgi:hypothetical protein